MYVNSKNKLCKVCVLHEKKMFAYGKFAPTSISQMTFRAGAPVQRLRMGRSPVHSSTLALVHGLLLLITPA